MTIRTDQNGQPIYVRPRRLRSGLWAAVCYGSSPLAPTDVHVGLLRTRADARNGFIDGSQDYYGRATGDDLAEYYHLIGEDCWA